MTATINIQCQPSPFMFGSSGPLVLVQVDEAGHAQSDEAGNILAPDPEILIVQSDENNHPLTDENGTLNLPDL